MNFSGVSLFSIVWSALRPGVDRRRWAVTVSLLAALIAVLMVENWWRTLCFGLLACAYLRWPSRGRRQRVACAGDNTYITAGVKVGQRADDLARSERLNPIVGRGQAHHSLYREAQLIKAGVLWHLHGDRYGARGHCHDLLSKIQPSDPLFAEICNLYLCTCRTLPSRTAKSAAPLPAGFPQSTRPMPVRVGGAKIIPFKSPDVRASSTA